MSVIEVSGDLFDSKDPIIAHQVNCKKTMGSGVARQIKERFPFAYLDYMQQDPYLGKCHITQLGYNFGIAHLYGQDDYGRDPSRVYTNYKALRESLTELFYRMRRIGIYKVSMPRIGCGLGNADWTTIKSILEELSDSDITVTVYVK